MYCSKCGKQIKDDSKFCNYCGYKLEDRESVNNRPINNTSSSNTATDFSDNSGCGKELLITIIVLLIVFFAIFAIIKLTQNSDSTGGIVDRLTERDLRQSDYSVSTSEGLTSYTITITANVKINTCNVEIKIYDNSGKVIYSDTQTKNDLLEGSSYTYKFDFGLGNALSAKEISYRVSGKCVE